MRTALYELLRNAITHGLARAGRQLQKREGYTHSQACSLTVFRPDGVD